MSRTPNPVEHATFEQASAEILRILEDGGWHKRTAELGRLSPWVPNAMFGAVKKQFNIKHQRVGGGPGSYFEWHRCPDCAALPINERCPAVAYARDASR